MASVSRHEELVAPGVYLARAMQRTQWSERTHGYELHNGDRIVGTIGYDHYSRGRWHTVFYTSGDRHACAFPASNHLSMQKAKDNLIRKVRRFLEDGGVL